MAARVARSVGMMIVVVMVVFAIAFPTVSADPDLLQDLCVADLASGPKVNGFSCKANATADDFYFAGLNKPGQSNVFGSAIATANVLNIPGLNTLGVSLARIDYAPGGINAPHTHPRASEVMFVLEGELEVAFMTTEDVLYSKNIKKGETFVFPEGLIHYQKNTGRAPASAIVGFNSQLPGTIKIPIALFSKSMPNDVLEKSLHLGSNEINRIKADFAPK